MNEFFSPAITGLADAVPLFLVATGLSIVYRVTGTVNFAQGAFYMVGAYVAYSVAGQVAPGGGVFGLIISIAVATALVGALGLAVEFVLMRRTYKLALPLQLLATFAIALIAQDVIMEIWGPQPLTSFAAGQVVNELNQGGAAIYTYDVILIALAPVVPLFLWLLYSKSPWSTHIRAIIHDSEMVAILGIRQRWMFTYTVILGAALAGLGGALQMPRAPIHLGMDEQMLVQAFIVTIVGALGSVSGALMAAIIVGQLGAFGALLVPGGSAVFLFLILGLIVAARPQGLFGGTEIPSEKWHGAGHRPPTLPRILFLMIFVGAVIALGVVPFTNSPGIILVANEILIFVLFAASLQFIVGQGAMASFGHGLYLVLGAYVSATVVRFFALPLEATIVLAPIAAGLGVLIFGWFSIRLSGIYLAMLTLIFAQLGWSIAQFLVGVVGPGALPASVAPTQILTDSRVFYGLTLAIVVFALVLMRQISHSPFGLALRACRDCPERGAALGLDMTGLRWTALILAGVFAGLAGGLFAYLKVQTPEIMPIAASTDGLVMVLLGGMQTMLGPIVGATLYTTLKSLLVTNTEFWRLLIGLVIIAFVLLLPRGLIGGLSQVLGSRR